MLDFLDFLLVAGLVKCAASREVALKSVALKIPWLIVNVLIKSLGFVWRLHPSLSARHEDNETEACEAPMLSLFTSRADELLAHDAVEANEPLVRLQLKAHATKRLKVRVVRSELLSLIVEECEPVGVDSRAF